MNHNNRLRNNHKQMKVELLYSYPTLYSWIPEYRVFHPIPCQFVRNRMQYHTRSWYLLSRHFVWWMYFLTYIFEHQVLEYWYKNVLVVLTAQNITLPPLAKDLHHVHHENSLFLILISILSWNSLSFWYSWDHDFYHDVPLSRQDPHHRADTIVPRVPIHASGLLLGWRLAMARHEACPGRESWRNEYAMQYQVIQW